MDLFTIVNECPMLLMSVEKKTTFVEVKKIIFENIVLKENYTTEIKVIWFKSNVKYKILRF